MGLKLSGTNGCKTVAGNDFSGAVTPMAWDTVPTAALANVVANNGGLENAGPVTVACRATIRMTLARQSR